MGWVLFMAHQNNVEGAEVIPAPVVRQPTRATPANNGRSVVTMTNDGRNSIEVQ